MTANSVAMRHPQPVDSPTRVCKEIRSYLNNHIGSVMVMGSVLASSAVDRWFDTRLGQTKDYKSGICCFSAEHAALRKKSKNWLARNQNNVSEWSDMSTHGLVFQ